MDQKVRASEIYSLAKMADNPADALGAVIETKFRLYLTVGFFVKIFYFIGSSVIYKKEWEFPLLEIAGSSAPAFVSGGKTGARNNILAYNNIDNLATKARIREQATIFCTGGGGESGESDLVMTPVSRGEGELAASQSQERYTQTFKAVLGAEIQLRAGDKLVLSNVPTPLRISETATRRGRGVRRSRQKISSVEIDFGNSPRPIQGGLVFLEPRNALDGPVRLCFQESTISGDGYCVSKSNTPLQITLIGTPFNDELVVDLGSESLENIDVSFNLGKGDDTVTIISSTGSSGMPVGLLDEFGDSNVIFHFGEGDDRLDIDGSASAHSSTVHLSVEEPLPYDGKDYATAHVSPSACNPGSLHLKNGIQATGVEAISIVTGRGDDILKLCNFATNQQSNSITVDQIDLKAGLGSDTVTVDSLFELRKRQHSCGTVSSCSPLRLYLEGHPEGQRNPQRDESVEKLRVSSETEDDESQIRKALDKNEVILRERSREASSAAVIIGTNGLEYNYFSNENDQAVTHYAYTERTPLDRTDYVELVMGEYTAAYGGADWAPVPCQIGKFEFIDTAEECRDAAAATNNQLGNDYNDVTVHMSSDASDKNGRSLPYGCYWDTNPSNGAKPRLMLNSGGTKTQHYLTPTYTLKASVEEDCPKNHTLVFDPQECHFAVEHQSLVSRLTNDTVKNIIRNNCGSKDSSLVCKRIQGKAAISLCKDPPVTTYSGFEKIRFDQSGEFDITGDLSDSLPPYKWMEGGVPCGEGYRLIGPQDGSETVRQEMCREAADELGINHPDRQISDHSQITKDVQFGEDFKEGNPYTAGCHTSVKKKGTYLLRYNRFGTEAVCFPTSWPSTASEDYEPGMKHECRQICKRIKFLTTVKIDADSQVQVIGSKYNEIVEVKRVRALAEIELGKGINRVIIDTLTRLPAPDTSVERRNWREQKEVNSEEVVDIYPAIPWQSYRETYRNKMTGVAISIILNHNCSVAPTRRRRFRRDASNTCTSKPAISPTSDIPAAGTDCDFDNFPATENHLDVHFAGPYMYNRDNSCGAINELTGISYSRDGQCNEPEVGDGACPTGSDCEDCKNCNTPIMPTGSNDMIVYVRDDDDAANLPGAKPQDTSTERGLTKLRLYGTAGPDTLLFRTGATASLGCNRLPMLGETQVDADLRNCSGNDAQIIYAEYATLELETGSESDHIYMDGTSVNNGPGLGTARMELGGGADLLRVGQLYANNMGEIKGACPAN